MSLYSEFKSVVAVDDTQDVGVLLNNEVVRCRMGSGKVIIDREKDLSLEYYQVAVNDAKHLAQKYQGKTLFKHCSW